MRRVALRRARETHRGGGERGLDARGGRARLRFRRHARGLGRNDVIIILGRGGQRRRLRRRRPRRGARYPRLEPRGLGVPLSQGAHRGVRASERADDERGGAVARRDDGWMWTRLGGGESSTF
eukprot:31186-Pelagococcus_subviridis.AAC.2